MIDEIPEVFLRQYCYSQGEFCVFDADYFDPLSVLEEGLRQMCIYKTSASDNDSNKLWWNYILNYRDCLTKEAKDHGYRILDCYIQVYENIALTEKVKQTIDACMDSSWSFKEDKFLSANKLMTEDENPIEYSEIFLVPAVFVNNNLVKEDLSERVIVSAVCEELITKPEYCSTFFTKKINMNANANSKDNQKTTIIFFVLLFAAISMAFVFFLIRRSMNTHIQGEISDEIRNHVSEYMKLRNSK